MRLVHDHPRATTYGAVLATVALYGLRAYLYGGTGLGWLAVAAMATGILHLAGSNLIRETINYHPAYKVEKLVAGVVACCGALGIWWGVDWLAYAWFAAAALLCVEAVAFEFILFKGTGFGEFLRTIFGLVPVPTPVEALMHAEYTAGLIRHELIPTAGMQAIEEAQRIPPKSEWLANIRAELARRRAEAAENDRLATAAEVDALLEQRP